MRELLEATFVPASRRNGLQREAERGQKHINGLDAWTSHVYLPCLAKIRAAASLFLSARKAFRPSVPSEFSTAETGNILAVGRVRLGEPNPANPRAADDFTQILLKV